MLLTPLFGPLVSFLLSYRSVSAYVRGAVSTSLSPLFNVAPLSLRRGGGVVVEDRGGEHAPRSCADG